MATLKSIYAKRRAALVDAQVELETLTDKLQQLANLCARWEHLILPDSTEESEAFAQSALHIISADDWVTYDDFLRALRVWKDAYQSAFVAFEQVDPDEVEKFPQTLWQRQERSRESAYRQKLLKSLGKKSKKRLMGSPKRIRRRR